jgi:hypothetical protein
MPELMRESVGLSRIRGWGRKDRSVALKHKLMLGVIGAMLSFASRMHSRQTSFSGRNQSGQRG